jgi:hypothetical protein
MKRIIFLIVISLFLISLVSSFNFPSTGVEVIGGGTTTTVTWTGNLTNFTDLQDTPNSFAGDGGDCLKVNAGETAIEFVACGGGGDFSFTDFAGAFNSNASAYTFSTYNATYNLWAYNQTYSGSTYNATYAANVGNASWNESYANTLYASIGSAGGDFYFNNFSGSFNSNVTGLVLNGYFNTSLFQSAFNTNSTYLFNTSLFASSFQTNISDWESRVNSSYLSTYNATYEANQGNASWNESYADNLYVNKSGDVMTGNLLPSPTLTLDLGSGANRWNLLYVANISSERISTYSLSATENVSGDMFIGNGAYLTDLNISGDLNGYTINASYLVGGIGGMDIRGDPWYLSGTNLQVVDNITASYFIGDGSLLTGISGNSSWNESYANGLYFKPNNFSDAFILNISNWETRVNDTYLSIFNSSYDVKITDNESWNESYANTLYATLSAGGDFYFNNFSNSFISNISSWEAKVNATYLATSNLWATNGTSIYNSTVSQVGIGTATPTGKLTISSTVAETIPALGERGGKLALLRSNGYGLLSGVTDTGLVYFQSQRVDGTPTAYNLALQPNGGSVGIGTITPTHTLNVVGNTNLSGSLWAGNSTLFVNTSSVGIGTTAMVAPLTFADTTGIKIGLYGTSYGIGVESSELRIATNGATTFYTGGYAGSEKMRLLVGGNLGIGTTTPTHTLNVVGGTNITSNSIYENNLTMITSNRSINLGNGRIYWDGSKLVIQVT